VVYAFFLFTYGISFGHWRLVIGQQGFLISVGWSILVVRVFFYLFFTLFRRVRKISKCDCFSFVVFVRPHGTATRLPPDGFSLNLIFEFFVFVFFEKSVKKIHVPLKSNKNNGHLT
jgi:hypothetical protein